MGLEPTQQSSSIIPSQDPGHYDWNWIFQAVSPRPWIKWLLMFWEDSSLASTAWLFSTGHRSEKPHHLFRGRPPEKASSRPWFEIAGWARSYFRYSKCVKLFPKHLGMNTATEVSHRKSSSPDFEICVYIREVFWFWCPYTNCQHSASFFTVPFMYLKEFSSLNKKPQLQVCLKQKPLNIWSSVWNS